MLLVQKSLLYQNLLIYFNNLQFKRITQLDYLGR